MKKFDPEHITSKAAEYVDIYFTEEYNDPEYTVTATEKRSRKRTYGLDFSKDGEVFMSVHSQGFANTLILTFYNSSALTAKDAWSEGWGMQWQKDFDLRDLEGQDEKTEVDLATELAARAIIFIEDQAAALVEQGPDAILPGCDVVRAKGDSKNRREKDY